MVNKIFQKTVSKAICAFALLCIIITSTPLLAASATSWSSSVSNLLQTTESTWARMLFSLLLGTLLSLTPCIYPMIPITIGILQSQATSSPMHNFFLSLAYTVGIATTFALLGLMAAVTGAMFGNILAHPIFIMAVVAMLGYLAFAMLGFYEMYVPRFAQKNRASSKRGSVISAFLFGAASGTVASPCLSPGLILLLTLVTTLGNKLLGFVLLFCFGIGLGIPLLLIGTFSGAMHVMPRAGMWMVEVKKLFGFILLGMCIYFINTALPWTVTLWLITALVLFAGIFFLIEIGKRYKNFKTMGTILLAPALLMALYTTRITYHTMTGAHHTETVANYWMTEYQQALLMARTENKKIFVDIYTSVCPLCTMLDRKLFSNIDVAATLCSQVIPLKINAADTSSPENVALLKRLGVMGAPTCILIDPNNQELEACRWTGELCQSTPAEFITTLNTLTTNTVQ